MKSIEMIYRDFQAQITSSEIDMLSLIKFIDSTLNNDGTEAMGRDLLLRLLNQFNNLNETWLQPINDLVEKSGYYPYLKINEETSLKTAIHYEFYRSENIPEIVMHQKQAQIYGKIEEGKSLILSAPTSFGKSLLIEEIVASCKYTNIVLIFPTIALIDENRAKLSKYRDRYKIIFTTKQIPTENNIFILTPERFVEFENLPLIDFFIIDEFYKLSEIQQDDNMDRANVLNHAFYKLLKQTKDFYLLGPNISSIPQSFLETYPSEFISTDYFTVTNNEYKVNLGNKNKSAKLNELLQTIEGATIIYCKSPNSVEKHAKQFADFLSQNNNESNAHKDAIEWIANNVHSDWWLIDCLKNKIAFHHGSMPRHLSKYVINEFNKGNIDYLFCTSTLIEGVNTAAKNVVIFDNIKGKKTQLTYFDYKNIRGRAGRMNRHYVGNIYNFNSPPEVENFDVDIPWFTQTNASDEILIQLSDEDLKVESKHKLESYKNQQYLDISTIQKNSNMKVKAQIQLAKNIRENHIEYHPFLNWTGLPTYEQLEFCCKLLWDNELISARDNIFSSNQLAFFANNYKKVNSSLKGLIDLALSKNPDLQPNKAVQDISKIVKSWFEFRFPKALLTLDIIQKEIYQEKNIKSGDYKYYATCIESAFCHPTLAVLQEFGLPLTIIKKLESQLSRENLNVKEEEIEVEHLISLIKKINRNQLDLDNFEIFLLNEFLSSF